MRSSQKRGGLINNPLALEEKHRANAPDRQSDRHCEARRYALDGAASLVGDADDIGAESAYG